MENKKLVELIFVPIPSPGHLLAMIEFAKRLVDQDRRINTITIISWKLPFSPQAGAYARSLAASHQHSIRLIDMPDIQDPPPSELYTTSFEAYMYEYVEKSRHLVKKTIMDISSSSPDSVRVAGLVLDFFCVHLIDVADELKLPSYIFLTSDVGFLGVMQYLPERHREIPSEFDKSDQDQEVQIPGFFHRVPTKVLPPGLFDKTSYDAYVKLGQRFADAKGIFVNSFAKLEPYALNHFAKGQNYPPVYPVGPVLNLENRPNPRLDRTRHEEILKWLDGQPESSVVFLCFGSSGITFRPPQVKEIARGLELSGHRFLWSTRTHLSENKDVEELLPEGFMGRVMGRGMVCEWVPQVEVLAHKAVGGFVSHCGWNSILESLWYGVPIVTWPMYAEQQLNAFTLVKELGLAVELTLDYVEGESELVIAEEIVRAVKCLMEGDHEVRKMVKEISEEARKAVMDGGSSFVALASFIREIIR